MNHGHNRETVFADDEDRLYFLDLLARYRERFELRLYHYCLMDNHFHLLLQLAQPRRLSALMAGLLRAFTHHFHRRHALGEVNELLAANPWYVELSPRPARRQVLWREFLMEADLKEKELWRDDWVVGGETFRGRLAQVAGRPARRGRGRPSRALEGITTQG
jgi:REP element-mobilizing transposase RayT